MAENLRRKAMKQTVLPRPPVLPTAPSSSAIEHQLSAESSLRIQSNKEQALRKQIETLKSKLAAAETVRSTDQTSTQTSTRHPLDGPAYPIHHHSSALVNSNLSSSIPHNFPYEFPGASDESPPIVGVKRAF